jgi:putative DNA primase/helicase
VWLLPGTFWYQVAAELLPLNRGAGSALLVLHLLDSWGWGVNAPNVAVAALGVLREAGLVLDHIEFDGTLHRCPVDGKPHGKDGAYIAHEDAPASLWWCDWASGENGTWTAKGQSSLTVAEREALAQRMEANRKEREAEQARVHAEAAEKAKRIYAAAVDCTGHPYLTRKGVQPVPGLKVSADPDKYPSLIVPVFDEHTAITGLQFILPEKPEGGRDKNFLTGTDKAGHFFPIGGKAAAKPLLICEGLATGLSLYECTDYPVLVAFDAGNLLPVAELARRLYPEREIVLCADFDDSGRGYPDPGGIGLAKATAAALAIGGSLAVPHHEGRRADWNDLHRLMGSGEVRTQFMNHERPEPQRERQSAREEKLPAGFSLRTGGSLPGLWHTEPKEGGDPVETWVGPPLHVLGATRDEHGNAWGLLLQWEDPDGRTHIWAMPKSLLVGKDTSAWLGRLADEGWSGAPGASARNKLAQYLSTYRTDRRVRCVDRTGWHREAFVFPDTVIENRSDKSDRSDKPTETREKFVRPTKSEVGQVGQDSERIVLQVQTPHNPFRMAGTLDGWRDSVGTWARGNSRLMMALCAALAAPLLKVAGQESGGFNWTGQSSTGKTTALVAAGSVWGKGSSSGGYLRNWRATSNGLEGLAALHSDAALCLDEIGQAPGRTIMEAAYMLANGMGKARALADGSAKETKSWRCMVLSTGEKGLAEKIVEEGGRVQAGQLVRLIDIPADAGAGFGLFEDLHGHESPQAFADAVKQAAAAHYGHAAREFIGAIQGSRDEAASELRNFHVGGVPLLCPDDASGQVQRVARRFLLCAAAGERAAEWGLLPWKKGEALQAVKVCFDAWLTLRGGAGATEDTAIVEQVSLFIEQHGASRFQDVDAPTAICINRVGFRRSAENGTEFMILPESFRAEVCKGFNPRRAATILCEKGLLIPGDGKNLPRRPPCDLPGFGRRRCYTLLIKEGASNVDD